MGQFAAAVKSLVSANRLKLALAVLADHWKDTNHEQHNQCVVLQSALAQAEKEYALGIIARGEAGQALARIRYAALRLADEADEALTDDAAACQRAAALQQTFLESEFSVQHSASKPNRWVWAAAGGAAGVAALLYFLGAISQNAAPTSRQLPMVAPIDTAVAVDALTKEAEQYYAQGNFAKALEAASKAITLRPDRGALYNARASTYLKQGNIVLAAADARRAVALAPDDCYAYATLAQVCTHQGDAEGFYQNIEASLKQRCDIWNFTDQPGIVEHRGEKRFQNLIAAYQAAQ